MLTLHISQCLSLFWVIYHNTGIYGCLVFLGDVSPARVAVIYIVRQLDLQERNIKRSHALVSEQQLVGTI